MLGDRRLGLWLRWRGRPARSRAFLNACIAMLPAGFVAVIAGWTVTEVGRQPWVVYGLLRTRDAVSPSLTGSDVLLSLALYIVVYLDRLRRGSSTWCASRARARRRRGAREPKLGDACAPAVGRRSRRLRETRCTLDLVPVWTVILGVGVFMYVLLDGFDLGIGILFPMARDDDEPRR